MDRFLAEEAAGKPRSELVMPPVDAGEHLVGLLFKVGPSTAGEVITFQELEAWSQLTGYRLGAWESETLRRLSGAYLSEHQQAEDLKRPPPFAPAVRVLSPAEVADRLMSVFDRLEAQDAKMGLVPKPVTVPKRRR